MKGYVVMLKKIALGTLLGIALLLAGCGVSGATAQGAPGAGVPGNEVDMGSVTFVQSSVTIAAGGQVNFVDPAGTGAFHILCFGHDQMCNPNASGPAGLNVKGGVPVNAGDVPLLYTFAKPGTYEVTCTVHPHMNVIVTVK